MNTQQESGPVPGAGAEPERKEEASEDALTPSETAAAPEAAAEPSGAEPDYRDRWLRAEAELQNYRRRVQREFEETRRGAEEGALHELLPVLDDLERALQATRDAGAPEGWSQGVALTAQRMRDALGRFGIEVVDPAGQPFDPVFHEAVLEMPAPEGVAPGTVLQVAQKGYRRGERALRAARVVVARSGGPS